MMNEFIYCQRLFYYEFVEGVFVESADTLRGGAIHQRVDSGSGSLPAASKSKVQGPKSKAEAGESDSEIENEVIHSRSVQMGSERLGVVAKMDLVEARGSAAPISAGDTADLFTAFEVCPVDYKAGAPKE